MSKLLILGLMAQLPFAPGMDVEQYNQQVEMFPQRWQAAAEFLSKPELNELELGRYEILGNEVFAIIQEYDTRMDGDFEAHRDYVDIQCVLEGSEYIYVAPTQECSNPVEEYKPESDIIFYRDAQSYRKILADKDNYVVLFPSDAHQPCMSIGSEATKIRKVVIKIRYN